MDKELLIEALQIAISNFDYDQEWDKADELRDYRDKLKKEREGENNERPKDRTILDIGKG
jgi:hypothetical protein